MSVYVDDMKAKFGRMVMCHMIADSSDELLAMADAIGVDRKWIQHPGTHKEHFDIALSKRALAVAAGAIEITWAETGRRILERRKAPARACACPDLDAIACYRNRYKRELGDGDYFLEDRCDCACHAEARCEERDEADARGEA